MCTVKVFAAMFFFNLICNMTTSNFFLPFNPTHRLRVCVRTEYVLAWCSKLHPFNLVCNRTTFRKKNVLTPPQGLRVCVRNMCLHVTAFVISFNLISNLDQILKS